MKEFRLVTVVSRGEGIRYLNGEPTACRTSQKDGEKNCVPMRFRLIPIIAKNIIT